MNVVKVVRAMKRHGSKSDDSHTTCILEDRRENLLQPALCADDPDGLIPPSFGSGPVFVTFVRNGYFEPSTGYAFTSDRSFIKESARTDAFRQSVAARYQTINFEAASSIQGIEAPPFVVSTVVKNFCRWWLDQVSKYFIFDSARQFHSTHESAMRYISNNLTSGFQLDTLSVLGLSAKTEFPDDSLLRGDFYMSSGLTFAGGQRISPVVTSFRTFVLDRLDQRPETIAPQQTPGRIYISRARAKMRRLLNEEELDPILERNGFVKVTLETLAIAEQIAMFRAADAIVGPHGVGLTNIMFCRPGTRILEMFPRAGLHSSAFMRIASLCHLGYGYVCGDSVENSVSAENRNNADIICPAARFEHALASVFA